MLLARMHGVSRSSGNKFKTTQFYSANFSCPTILNFINIYKLLQITRSSSKSKGVLTNSILQKHPQPDCSKKKKRQARL
jgi:hypothetical protein